MKVYKLFYADEYEHPMDIEVIKEGSMLKYVLEMIANEQITDFEKLPKTEQEAIDIVENGGYFVEKITMYE